MSHSVLDFASHVIAGLFLIYRIDHAAIDSGLRSISDEARREHQLHVCGAVMAAVANLDDTWREAKGSEQDHLKQAFDFLSDRIAAWRELGILPKEESCRIDVDNEHMDVQAFQVEAYRLDGGDNPSRRVNWSYRFTRELR